MPREDNDKLKTVAQTEAVFPLSFQIHQLSLKLAAQARTLISRHGDLTLPQWRVIRIIGFGTNEGSTSIRKTLDFDKSQFSKIVSQLQEHGFVEITDHPSDGRQFCLVLTKTGRDALDALSPTLDSRNEALMQALSTDERTMIESALSKLSIASEVTDYDKTK